MNLIVETTAGLLVPGGTAVQLPRGPIAATLQLVTNGVATLLPEGQPVSLSIYQLAAPGVVVQSFAAWTRNAAAQLYTATLNPLTGGLGWLQDPLYLGRVSYGAPNVDTPQFHVRIGGTPVAAPQIPQIVITQPAGQTNFVQEIGLFSGQLATGQSEGYWRAKAAGSLLGLQLAAQVAPTGANVLVEVYKNGVATGKVATLTAGSKKEETIFGAPLAVAIGDVIEFRCTQIGSVIKGSNLNVKGVMQLQ